MADRKWRGITTNFAVFQGEIISDPTFNGEYGFLTLRTIATQRDANGQIVELDQDIPLMIEPGSANLRVAREYIKTGRKLQVWCHYKSWESNGTPQHAFVVRKIDLGDKPYEGQNNGTPPLPA